MRVYRNIKELAEALKKDWRTVKKREDIYEQAFISTRSGKLKPIGYVLPTYKVTKEALHYD